MAIQQYVETKTFYRFQVMRIHKANLRIETFTVSTYTKRENE